MSWLGIRWHYCTIQYSIIVYWDTIISSRMGVVCPYCVITTRSVWVKVVYPPGWQTPDSVGTVRSCIGSFPWTATIVGLLGRRLLY